MDSGKLSTPNLTFPAGFTWGTATSAYQIEGAWDADGKGESIWDRFTHTPGNIIDGTNGDVTCDHYHRWPEDVALMKTIGIQAYRFSIAWTRIQPEGRGPVNPAGLDFYSRLVDSLLETGITPCATLYHWDLPQELQDRGGWPTRSTAEAFLDYTDQVTRRLGDRVAHWITHNEPWVAAFVAHQMGAFPPGLEDSNAALRASHHLLLSHGWAVPVIRGNVPDARIGAAPNLTHVEPATASPGDQDAARRLDGHVNRWFLDPLYGRGYPADMVADHIAWGHLPPAGLTFAKPGDLAAIAAPTDFLGINYYTRAWVAAQEGVQIPSINSFLPGSERTETGWEIYPDGLYQVLMRLHREYQVPRIYITENGASYSDGPGPDGQVRDQRRLNYLRDHISAAHQAVQAGAPLAGYFVWSLLDNFEWTSGFTQRFGLVWVNFSDQTRILKESGRWYRRVIEENGLDQTSSKGNDHDG